jgi:hypothetical protein
MVHTLLVIPYGSVTIYLLTHVVALLLGEQLGIMAAHFCRNERPQ